MLKLLSLFTSFFTWTKNMRFRHVYMVFFSLVVLAAMVVSDPDTNIIQNLPFGGAVVASLIVLGQAVLLVVLFHLSRRGLFDYIHLWDFFKKSLETPEAASRALVALSIMMFSIAYLIVAGVQRW